MFDSESDTDRLENVATRIIRERGGDVRKALKALIIANEHLEAELNDVCAKVSTGFMRGTMSRNKIRQAKNPPSGYAR
jgi:hypothetical protein